MNVKQLTAACVTCAAMAAGNSAFAQMKLTGAYVGGGVGSSNYSDINTTGINQTIVSVVPGVTSALTTGDETETGWKLFAGYQFHPNFAAEVSYANLGKFSTFSTSTPSGSYNGEVKLENTWSFDLLGIWPLQNNFSLFGRIGLLYAEAKTSFSGTGPTAAAGFGRKDDDWNYKLGLGAGYEFTNNIGVRGEWERYRVPDGVGGHSDVDLFSVSLRFKF